MAVNPNSVVESLNILENQLARLVMGLDSEAIQPFPLDQGVEGFDARDAGTVLFVPRGTQGRSFEHDGVAGVVREIRMMHTVVETFDGKTAYSGKGGLRKAWILGCQVSISNRSGCTLPNICTSLRLRCRVPDNMNVS